MNAEASQNPNLVERIFKIREKNSSVRTEIIAGMTTFIALAYIMFVNPNILSEAGIPSGYCIYHLDCGIVYYGYGHFC